MADKCVIVRVQEAKGSSYKTLQKLYYYSSYSYENCVVDDVLKVMRENERLGSKLEVMVSFGRGWPHWFTWDTIVSDMEEYPDDYPTFEEALSANLVDYTTMYRVKEYLGR